MRRGPSLLLALAAGIAVALAGGLAVPHPADASSRQLAIIMDGVPQETDATLPAFHALGATTVRVIVFWHDIAPRAGSSRAPAQFHGSDPAAYPAKSWAPYDRIVRDARAQGMTVDLDVAGGAPRWAEGPGIPPQGRNPSFAWKPSPRLYGDFVHAVGERYDGRFRPRGQSTPLPAVRFWALWNEPNFGQDLGPQAIDGSRLSVGPMMYRDLVANGWRALHQTGHGGDTILIGELAAEGRSGPVNRKHPQGLPGDYAQTKPLQFIRTLYCVDSHYRELRGSSARARGCPTTAPASRRFRRQNPGLFDASGVADHPYAGNRSPVNSRGVDPDFAIFPVLGRLERTLDRVNRVYGSGRRYAIYSDEYGYITHPPQIAGYPSPAQAASYLNWAEYVSYRSPRVASFAQYLLNDPVPYRGKIGFASGLLTDRGKPKATYDAYRMPLYVPHATVVRGDRTEVWGGVRPAHFAQAATRRPQAVAIQLQTGGHGSYRTLQTVRVSSLTGYFDVRLRLPTSGNLRLQYTYPTQEPFLPMGTQGTTIHSRLVRVTLGRGTRR